MTLARRHLPSMAALRALEALERLGSATAVAEELNQTQSAVSRQLRQLEESLNTPLFTKKNKRLHLTPDARAYAQDMRTALEHIASATMKLSLNPAGGTVNLAILPTFGMRWLVPRLAGFAEAHPEVTINLTTRIDRVNFAAEPFDAAIVFEDEAQSNEGRILLKPEAVIAVCAPDLRNRYEISGAKDVGALPLLHIASRPHAWRDWFGAQNVQGIQTSGTVYDQFSTIMQAALHGLGCALIPDYLAKAELARGTLVPVWGDAVTSAGAYHLVYPQENAEDPALKSFCTWLRQQAEPEDDPLPR